MLPKLGFLRFLPYGKQVQGHRTLHLIASSITVILVAIFSVFEVGVGLKTGVPVSRTTRFWLPGQLALGFCAFALRKAVTG